IPTTASGDTNGDGGVTSCIGFTFTCSSAGPGCANHALIDSSSSLRNEASPQAHRFRNLTEIGVLQVRVERHQASRLLLDIDETELAIVVDHDLDRQFLLHRGQEIAEQHGEPAIAGKANHLPAGSALLQPE